MTDERLTKLERILISWDKEDRMLYAAARLVVRSGYTLERAAMEYEVNIDDLAEVAAELSEHEQALAELDGADTNE
jgi:hypothetical protein